MMRLLLGLLLAGNLLLFLYGYLGLDDRGAQPPQRLHQPDVGSIRLLAARVSPVDSTEELLAHEEKPVETGEPGVVEEAAPETAAPVSVAEADAAVETAVSGEPAAETESMATGVLAKDEETVPAQAAEESPLVAEEEPVPAPEEEAQASSVLKVPVTYCGTLGPFKSRIQAKRIRRKLGALKKIGIEQKPTLVDKSYWVLIPPLPTRKEARAVVEKLKAAGVKDLWLVPKGEMRNAISLGLYSRKDAAYSHAENLRKKGFEVEVKPKQEEVPRYWLEFAGLDEAAFEKLDPEALPQGVEVDKKVCGQASSVP